MTATHDTVLRGSRARRSWSVGATSLVVALCVAGCGSTATPSEGSSTSEPPVWDMVVMGDSVWWDIGGRLATSIRRAGYAEVEVHEWINPDLDSYADGGERSADLLARLRTDEQLRAELAEAEIVLFDVPMGAMHDTCSGDPATTPADVVAACLADMSTGYRADAAAIFDELVALRDPADAMIRVMDVWQFLYPTFEAAGTLDTARSAWLEMNGAVTGLADDHGIPAIPAYDTFCGPDGDRDPVAAGDLQNDAFHLTAQGQVRLVELIIESGFAPLR